MCSSGDGLPLYVLVTMGTKKKKERLQVPFVTTGGQEYNKDNMINNELPLYFSFFRQTICSLEGVAKQVLKSYKCSKQIVVTMRYYYAPKHVHFKQETWAPLQFLGVHPP